VSRWLGRARVGVVPTSFHLWQKSGTCAAMVAHGLPVVFSEQAPPGDQPWPTRFAVVRGGGLEWFDAPPERRLNQATPEQIWTVMFGNGRA
jgi:hypothetical protein